MTRSNPLVRRRARTWQPRCEGCGIFVPAEGYSLSDFRWCNVCEAALPFALWKRNRMVDRAEAECHGFERLRRELVEHIR